MKKWLIGKKMTMSAMALALTIPALQAPALTAEADEGEATKVVDEDGISIIVNAENDRNNTNKLVVFDPTFSYFTETNGSSYEVILKKDEGNSYHVVSSGQGDSAIPEDGVVLSTGPQTTDEILRFLKSLEKGESVSINEPVERTYANTLDDIDPTDESNPEGAPFPGNRGANQLLLYTPAFGSSTGTNPYGYEITVTDGVVAKIGGGDSSIPSNGFVVSGHGTEAEYLKKAEIGMKVEYDTDGKIELIRDASTYIFKSEQTLQEAKQSIAHAEENYIDAEFKKAHASVKEAEEFLKKAGDIQSEDPQKALEYTEEATQAAYDAYYYSLPSEVGEQRAIWYRPEEKDLDDVITTLDRMEEAGFNSLYLETTFWGYTIFPSDTMEAYGLPKQHPNFANQDYGKYGSDILKAFIEEGKKRGITIQSWTDGFMIGHSSLGLPSQFKKYPEWSAVQRNDEPGTPGSDSSSNYYWLDIANPDVQDFMLDIYKEQQEDYKITGVNIDYMRYPHHPFDKSYGFSASNRERFETEFGVDPMDLEESDALWEEWENWLREQENTFVDQLHVQSKDINPAFMVTATPEPGAEAVLISDWVEDIDGVIPQAYGHDFNSIQSTVIASKKLTPPSMMYYTGIYSFYHHLGEKAAVNDVLAAGHGTSGVNMFAFGQASAPSVDALGKGPWRDAAVNPGEDPKAAVQATVKQLKEQTVSIYIPKGAVNKEEGKELENNLRKWEKMMERPDQSLKKDKVEKEFEKTVELINSFETLNPVVKDRVVEKLDKAHKWLNYYFEKQQ
ncbi:family 10 glycosylhydrolase [Rossellomorea vietnamensis]|uniref:glycoside hydrolase family 10 protein n=1 Tax=Rossellomorea vietnamensis TaxID=218284 RepID=UPI001CC9EDB4|nr:family 10 glycosylhydrolase [Rossellomorea vietnamensis]MCA0150413.1 family 10 glycosylhydrolase [Rossellomorea vietnamensis]